MFYPGLADNLVLGCSNNIDYTAQSIKMVYDFISFDDSVSSAGSIFNRSILDDLTITQEFSDFYGESASNTISFVDSGVGVVNRVLSASNTISLLDSFVFAGTAGFGGSTPINAIFDSTTSKGMVVYVSSDGHVDLALANNATTSRAVGLAQDDVSSGVEGSYLTEGQIEQVDWTSVIGTTLLTPGVYYYLSETNAGELTTTSPSQSGEYVVAVGRALTTKILDIEIAQPILL